MGCYNICYEGTSHLPIPFGSIAGFLQFGKARMALLISKPAFGDSPKLEALIGFRLTNSVLQQAGANGRASFAASSERRRMLQSRSVCSRVAFRRIRLRGLVNSRSWNQIGAWDES